MDWANTSGGGGDGEARERGDAKGRVAGWAGYEKGPGEGVDLVEVQGCIVWGWEGGLVDAGAQVGRVAGFDGEDGACGSEIVLGRNVCCCAEVGGDTDAFEDGGEGHEGGWIGVGEVIDAFRWSDGTGGGEAGGQEGDVVGFVGRDTLEVSVEGCIEACGGELGGGEVGQALTVEGRFEMLEGQGVLENGHVALASGRVIFALDAVAFAGLAGGLDGWSSIGGACGQAEKGQGGRPHLEYCFASE